MADGTVIPFDERPDDAVVSIDYPGAVRMCSAIKTWLYAGTTLSLSKVTCSKTKNTFAIVRVLKEYKAETQGQE